MTCIERLTLIANGISAIGTVGSFGALIYLYIKDKNNKNLEFFHNHCPYLVVGSPCGIDQDYCNVNISNNYDEIPVYENGKHKKFSEIIENKDGLYYSDYYGNTYMYDKSKGRKYFSIGNIGNNTAFDCCLIIYDNCKREIHKQYISHIKNNTHNGDLHFVYSKHYIDPNTKEYKFNDFDLFSCINDCEVDRADDKTETYIKKIYINIVYYNSPFCDKRDELKSGFEINIDVKKQTILQIIKKDLCDI